jgi:hypothetical protein
MLVNHFVANFLVVIIFFFYGLIVYFNINSVKTLLQNKIVDIYDSQEQCNYGDLALIPDPQTCKKGPNSGRYFITSENLTFTLSTVSSNYSDICKTICLNYNPLSQECDDNKNIDNFHTCIELLSPKAACKDLSNPLGYRFSKNTKNKVNLYAKDNIQLNSCI